MDPLPSAMPPDASKLMTAVGHPLRRQILRVYLDESLQCASAGEMARATDEPIARVAYHLKTLAGCDVLRLVHGHDGSGAERSDDSDGEGAEDGGREVLPHAWALDVEGGWLRLMLDFWAQSDLAD